MTAENGKDTRLLREITPRNLLSFAESEPLELRNLNVLIGPNGSGKSNLIEVINLLRHIPTDIRPVMSKGGGAAQWRYKGCLESPSTISVSVNLDSMLRIVEHEIQLSLEQTQFRVSDESINRARPSQDQSDDSYVYKRGRKPPGPMAFGGYAPVPGQVFDSEKLDKNISILAQIRDPDNVPDITDLSSCYTSIGIYRDWHFGRGAVFRTPQPTDLRRDRLEEDFSNIGMFLNKIYESPKLRVLLEDHLRSLYADLQGFFVRIEGGTVQVWFSEENDRTIPATRLSDGSLRYLCLLTLLCDPAPPPLICIEEPELGLHPDLLPGLADLLVEASSRTQLIVTTHSDILIDAFTERPEDVVVFEKHDGATQLKRLDANELVSWLERYRLGELWSRGHIGGNRW